MSLEFQGYLTVTWKNCRPGPVVEGESDLEKWEHRIEWDEESKWRVMLNEDGEVIFNGPGDGSLALYQTGAYASGPQEALEIAEPCIREHCETGALQEFVKLSNKAENGLSMPLPLLIAGGVLAAVIAALWLAT